MSDKLVNKRMVDVDALITYLEEDTDFGYSSDIGSLVVAIERFAENTVPDVEVGQTVYVITDGVWDDKLHKCDKTILECFVHKKTIKKRYTFSVRSHEKGNWYNGTFTINSIGKTVFFSREDALSKLKKGK